MQRTEIEKIVLETESAIVQVIKGRGMKSRPLNENNTMQNAASTLPARLQPSISVSASPAILNRAFPQPSVRAFPEQADQSSTHPMARTGEVVFLHQLSDLRPSALLFFSSYPHRVESDCRFTLHWQAGTDPRCSRSQLRVYVPPKLTSLSPLNLHVCNFPPLILDYSIPPSYAPPICARRQR